MIRIQFSIYFSLPHLNIWSLNLNQWVWSNLPLSISTQPSLALSAQAYSVHPQPILLRRRPQALPSFPTTMDAHPYLPDLSLIMAAPTLTRRRCSLVPPTPLNWGSNIGPPPDHWSITAAMGGATSAPHSCHHRRLSCRPGAPSRFTGHGYPTSPKPYKLPDLEQRGNW
jgi:hypothetical protein